MQIRQALIELKQASQSETPVLDAQVLLSHLLGRDKSFLIAHAEQNLTFKQEKQLKEYMVRLSNQEPLPYIIGEWEFFGKKFYVSPHTLIPRPETEELVERVSEWLKKHPQVKQTIDIGTGSGCIAITVVLSFPQLDITATDISPGALKIARKNARRHKLEKQIKFREQNLLEGDSQHYQLIMANLPYIPRQTLDTLPVAQHEPWLALDGGENGFELIEALLQQVRTHLQKPFYIICEIEYRHAQIAQKTAQQFFPEAHITILKDLSKNDRFLVINSL